MWEPFSEPARRGIVLAQELAQRLGNNYIGAEHIVVGTFEAGFGGAYDAFVALGVTHDRMNHAAERCIERGSGALQEMVFTPHAKRVIERGFEEAHRLSHRYIGSEHLLLGYLAEYGAKSTLLAELAIDARELRAKVLELLSGPNEYAAPRPPAQAQQADAAVLSLEQLFESIKRLDQPGMQSATEQGSERRVYYIDVEQLWKRCQGALGRRDAAGTMLYVLLITHREGRAAQQLLHEVLQRLQENYR